MDVPPVDYNLHICMLRGRNISYDMQEKQLNRQSNKGKQKPGIPPRQSSLQTNQKVNTSTCTNQIASE